MSMPHAAILAHGDTFACLAQPLVTLFLGRTRFQTSRGIFVGLGHLPMARNVFTAMHVALRRRRRRRALAGRSAGLRERSH